MAKLHFLLLVPLLLLPGAARSGPAPAKPASPTYELRLVRIFETQPTTYIFAVGESGFTSVASLKRFITLIPDGSTLSWAPGCKRDGSEPLLSSQKDMDAFAAHCKKEGVKFVLVPSG
jgi:hypothetical protein